MTIIFLPDSLRHSSSKPLVVELIESRGGKIFFTPKFHAELAPAECCYRDVSKVIQEKNIQGVSAGIISYKYYYTEALETI